MNANTTYDDWHPHELDTLPAAIDRVRAAYAAERREVALRGAEGADPYRNDLYDQPERTEPYAVSEWYHRHRIITGDELALYERRSAERFAPKPANMIDVRHERVRRTTGGAAQWSIRTGGEGD